MIAPEVVSTFNEFGEQPPVLMLFTLDTTIEGKIRNADVLPPEVMEMLMAGGRMGFEAYQSLRDDLTTPGSGVRAALIDAGIPPPDIVVQITEGSAIEVRARNLAEAERLRDESEHLRQECIVITMQALAYSVAALCPIKGNPKHATLVPLPEGPSFVGMRLSMTLD